MTRRPALRLVVVLAACLLLTAALASAAAPKNARKPAPPLKDPVHTMNKELAVCDYGGNKVCLVDATGRITWQIKAARPQDVWVLPNGNILFTRLRGVQEVNRDKKIVWEYKAPRGTEIHAAQPLPGGQVMVAESGPMRLIEVDRRGTITKEVKLTTKTKRAHAQMRGARKLPGGTYLVGQYADGVVREYDGDGKIVWEYKAGKAFGGHRLAGGNTLISTGDGHRIIEVDKAGRIVWQIKENDLPGNPLRFVAGMHVLPNGNLAVCNWGGHGHVRQQPQIFEVTRDKKVVGVLDDWKHFATLSAVHVLTDKGDCTKFEVKR